MAGFTNKGKMLLLEHTFVRAIGLPTTFHLTLATADTAPDADTDTMGDLTEIPTDNGYTQGGFSLTPGATDFDVITEDDSGDQAFVQIKDVTWTASGGPIPSSGLGASYACLCDDNATPALKEIYAYFALGSAITLADGQALTLQDTQMNLTET